MGTEIRNTRILEKSGDREPGETTAEGEGRGAGRRRRGGRLRCVCVPTEMGLTLGRIWASHAAPSSATSQAIARVFSEGRAPRRPTAAAFLGSRARHHGHESGGGKGGRRRWFCGFDQLLSGLGYGFADAPISTIGQCCNRAVFFFLASTIPIVAAELLLPQCTFSYLCQFQQRLSDALINQAVIEAQK